MRYQNGQAWTQDMYNEFKHKALNDSKLIRATIQAKDLVLVNQSKVILKGKELAMSESALQSLMSVLRLNQAIMKQIDEKLGEAVSMSLIKAMAVALGKDPEAKLAIAINTETNRVVSFKKTKDNSLADEAYFGLFERVMNNNKDMIIKNMSVTENGSLEISVLNNSWEFNVGNEIGLNDEYFKTGLVFLNTPTQTIINPFNERLVCTNGMVVQEKGLSIVLDNAGDRQASINAFFEKVVNIADMSSFEKEFKQRIRRMMSTQSSLSEMLMCRDNVLEHTSFDKTDTITQGLVENFIPVNELKRAYLEKHIDIMSQNPKVFKKIRTQLTVWELVNRLTDLSSHPMRHGFVLKYGNTSVLALQRTAGQLAFKKEYDHECLVPQLF
jgi:hypothetical protein